MRGRTFLLLVSVVILGACNDSEQLGPCDVAFESSACNGDPTTTARLRVVQGTTTGYVDVFLDNQRVLSSVGSGEASPVANVHPGTHDLSVKRTGAEAVLGVRSVTLAANDTATVILIDSSTVINPVVLTDTGAAPVAGKSKLRVVHFATNAPEIDVWRTQPDWSTLIRVMFPFNYRAASPYLQSDPGNWLVVVTPKDQTTQLYSTGNINIPAGHVRTVVLLDSPTGGITSVILNQ